MKCTVTEGPDLKDDMNFVQWHPKGNLILTGGKDNLLWLMNGLNGQYIGCMSGHKDKIYNAEFTIVGGGKLVVSCSADETIKVWSPKNGECIRTISKTHPHSQWHSAPINCFALHHTQPLIISGDLTGTVCCSNYATGQLIGILPSPHSSSVESIAFCLDEQAPYCVSAGLDSKMNIYDVSTKSLR